MQRTFETAGHVENRQTGFFHRRFYKKSERKVHRRSKTGFLDSYLKKDREALLQLYNALNGTDYEDASQLEVMTIESAVYIVMKNDLAFVVAGTINLYEHQSP